MLELTADNASDYLRDRGWLPDVTRVTELADGVSNAVLRIESPGRLCVLKQSRPQLRTREAWFSDLDRIFRERDVMVALRPHLPQGVVPEVLASDAENFVFLMSHAPEPFRNWRSVLLGGEVDLKLGELAGTLLAAIHEASATHPDEFAPFTDRTVFEQLRVDPFYQRVLERRPEVAGAVATLMERLRSVRSALC